MTRHGLRGICCVLGEMVAAGVLAAAAAGDAVAADGWPDSRDAGVFICRADFPLDGLRAELTELADLETDLSTTLKLPRAKEPIEIYSVS